MAQNQIKEYQGYVNQSLMDHGKHNVDNYLKIMDGLFKEAHLNYEQVFMFMRTLIRNADKKKYREYLDMNQDVANLVQDTMDYGWITQDGEYTDHCLNKLKEMGYEKSLGESSIKEEE